MKTFGNPVNSSFTLPSINLPELDALYDINFYFYMFMKCSNVECKPSDADDVITVSINGNQIQKNSHILVMELSCFGNTKRYKLWLIRIN